MKYIKINQENIIFQACDNKPQEIEVIKNNNGESKVVEVPIEKTGWISVDTDIREFKLVGMKYENNQITHSLQSFREEKELQLRQEYNKTKKITIVNGNNLIIEHDCPERKEFIKILELVEKSDVLHTSQTFFQKKSELGFNVHPEIITFILDDEFIIRKDNLSFKLRKKNKLKFENALIKINKSASINQIKDITWDFLKPDGVLINIDEKVKKIENSDNEKLKQIVENAKVDGRLHFIKTLEELEK
tara:strand:+ start:1459 stop:2199 length:741 start_codon:yes stop_codon:yes gene_type:complete